uniref:Calreticulin 3 n=1 Tax=Sus scrofa TaxID=9823 RepID=A0A8D0QVT9_PIG
MHYRRKLTAVNIFFFVGPDICGFDIKKVHVILYFKNQYHSNKKSIRCKVDGFTHLYTLILRPDLTYEVKIDGQSIESGSIEYDWQLTSLKKMEMASAESKDWDQATEKPQVRSGTIFDNFLITDDEEYAENFGKATWGETKDPEREMDAIQAKEEVKKAREEDEEDFQMGRFNGQENNFRRFYRRNEL